MNPEIFGKNAAGAQDAISRLAVAGHSDAAAGAAKTTVKLMTINNGAIRFMEFLLWE
jgi:hypothetical protein